MRRDERLGRRKAMKIYSDDMLKVIAVGMYKCGGWNISAAMLQRRR